MVYGLVRCGVFAMWGGYFYFYSGVVCFFLVCCVLLVCGVFWSGELLGIV